MTEEERKQKRQELRRRAKKLENQITFREERRQTDGRLVGEHRQDLKVILQELKSLDKS
jgi:hypothetical protein